MKQSLRTLFVLLACSAPVLLPATAAAVEVPTLFTATVPFDDTEEDGRELAYREALGKVLARVTGTELSTDGDAIDAIFPVPAAYVTQFRPGSDDTLTVSFDGQAIERVLRSNGHTVWGSDRPLTLIWLAVDWGRGVREIVAADDPDRRSQQSRSVDRNRLLRERLLDIAEERGVPILFPLLDTTDLRNVSFSDIWGGFDERVRTASGRYDVNSVLIGRVRPSSSGQNRWTFYFGDQQRDWTGSPETVVARIADLMASELAVGGSAPLRTVRLNVAGIESVEAYGSVHQALAETAMIEAVRIVEVSGNTVRFEIDVRGGESRLRRALRFAGLLEQERFDGGQPSQDVLDFYYGQ